ncbi:hypothetical protein [Rurimicrobium arvi]|uniref:DUF2846 domain-containing protein n=1 Tax=Rurimicrobium arvi TaxID=2049916 RepID=A0ABP8MND1_9BACT
MKPSTKTLLMLAATGMLASCTKKEVATTVHGYFYTPDSTVWSENPLHLYLDGVDKGSLPYIGGSDWNIPLTFSSAALESRALKVDFPSGNHIVEARTTSGKTVASSNMSILFYKNEVKSSSTSPIGGAGYYLDDNQKKMSVSLHP